MLRRAASEPSPVRSRSSTRPHCLTTIKRTTRRGPQAVQLPSALAKHLLKWAVQIASQRPHSNLQGHSLLPRSNKVARNTRC